MIGINFLKAKELTKERLRLERVPLLIQNDKEYIIAIKDGLDVDVLIEERQRLLDITNLADSAKTLDDLKNLKAQ